jgi:iron complex outermembrane receptor protein
MRYRSSYLGDFSTFTGEPARRRVKAETIFDGQIGYEFQSSNPLHGLSVFLQGQNLTNEPFVSYDHNDPMQILNYHTFGRRFMLGATYRFGESRAAPLPVVLPPPPPPAPPATQTCADGTVVLATEACPVVAAPPPPVATPERG